MPQRQDRDVEPRILTRVTYRTRKPWPAIAERRRFVIASRTPAGEPCTLIVERHDSGLIVSFHGAIRATAAPCPGELDKAPCPGELDKLMEALRTAVGGR